MICYSVRMLKILPDKAGNVIASLSRGGLLAEFKKQIPGYIGCSILESDLTNNLYLVIDFWRSKYDFFENEVSPGGIFLGGVLDRLAYQYSTLGPFSFPPTTCPQSEKLIDHGINSDSEVSNKVGDAESVLRWTAERNRATTMEECNLQSGLPDVLCRWTS